MDKSKYIFGNIYDPEKGESRTGTPPGTPFEDPPDNWICPFVERKRADFAR